jgi:putative flippase GtrA
VSERVVARRGLAARLPNRMLWRQLWRFAIVGVANTLISLIVYRLLLAVGTWYLAAAPIAYAAGLLNGYVWNRSWTFGSRDSMRARAMYVGVQIGGAALTSLLTLLFTDAAGLGHTAAFAAAAVPVTVCTFAANRAWTFSERERGL